MNMNERKFHCLVVDTTAFINNVSLQTYAEYLITVPEVINEIKNKRQLKRLCVLPYDLTVDEPSPECVKHVIAFAKKTGDYLSLSSADIKVIALTYQLEKELVGTSHLRSEPVMAKTIASKDRPIEHVDKVPLAGFYKPPKSSEELKTKTSLLLADQDLNEKISIEKEQITEESVPVLIDDADNNDINDELVLQLKNMELLSDKEADKILPAINNSLEDEPDVSGSEDDSGKSDTDSNYSADDSNDDDWITPSNIHDVISSYGKDLAEDKPVKVACMTTDYSVQNVLKQINLNVAALDGKIIKQMRTYILRCYACFKTTSLVTKIFCPKCGNKTLKRVAVSLDENGQQVIHINTRRPLTARGKNTSIPRPRGGKHSSNPILFEDQPIPKQMPSRVARTKTSALEEDYIAGFSPFVTRDIDSKSAILRAKGGTSAMKQWARNHEFKNLRRNQKK